MSNACRVASVEIIGVRVADAEQFGVVKFDAKLAVQVACLQAPCTVISDLAIANADALHNTSQLSFRSSDAL